MEKGRRISLILLMLAILLVLLYALLIPQEIKREQVVIKCTVVDTQYKHTSTRWIYTGKTLLPITISDKYIVCVKYKGDLYTIYDETAFLYCANKVDQEVKFNANIITYNNGKQKIEIISLITEEV